MVTFTEVLPQHTNRKRPSMEWTPIDEPSGPAVALLTLHNDRNTCTYRVEEFPADEGRGFVLLKLLEGTDKTESHYSLFCAPAGAVSCECKGYVAHGHCRHADAIRAALENRWL